MPIRREPVSQMHGLIRRRRRDGNLPITTTKLTSRGGARACGGGMQAATAALGRRHEPELAQVHVKVVADHGHLLVLLLLRLGFNIRPGHVEERVAHPVQLLDGLGEGEDGLEGLDELAEAGEVRGVGGLDDVAEEGDEGDEWRVEDGPGMF
jgi:hypothetical protein